VIGKTQLLVLVGVAVGGTVLGTSAALLARAPSQRVGESAPNHLVIDPQVRNFCSANSPLGVLVELTHNGQLPRGYIVGALHSNAGSAAFAAVAGSGEAAASVAAHLQQTAGVSRVGIIWAKSSRPAYHSCTNDLSDSKAGLAALRNAEGAATSLGYIQSPSAVVMAFVSDDPLTPGNLVVTLATDGGVVGVAPGRLGGPLHQLKSEVVIETTSGVVQAIGGAPWS